MDSVTTATKWVEISWTTIWRQGRVEFTRAWRINIISDAEQMVFIFRVIGIGLMTKEIISADLDTKAVHRAWGGQEEPAKKVSEQSLKRACLNPDPGE